MNSVLKFQILLVSGAALWVGQLYAQAHPPQPAVNLGETSFLDARGGPGGMVQEIGDASAATPSGAGGTSPQVNTVIGLTHVAGISRYRILGGWYGGEVLLPLVHINAGQLGAAGGVGDLTVSPLNLQWPNQRLGPVQLQQRFVLDFDLPTGEYQPAEKLSLSSHTFRIHPYYAFTLLPWNRLETSWRFHYLWSSKNGDPTQGGMTRSEQAGQAVHFNATLGVRVHGGVWLGANGYFLKQITSPRINGVSVPGSPEQVGAIGPGVVWDHKTLLLYANGYREFGAINRTEGNRIILRVQWIYGAKP